jgi:hypothetical protein
MNQLALINQVKELNNTLTTIQPDSSPTTKMITYALVATALTGIMVYHYIKNQETNN